MKKRSILKQLAVVVCILACIIGVTAAYVAAESIVEVMEEEAVVENGELADTDGNEENELVEEESDDYSDEPEYVSDDELTEENTDEEILEGAEEAEFTDAESSYEEVAESAAFVADDEKTAASSVEEPIPQAQPVKCRFSIYADVTASRNCTPDRDEKISIVLESSEGVTDTQSIVFGETEMAKSGSNSLKKEAVILKEYTEPGTYTYTVRQQTANSKGYTFDTTKYQLVVEVTEVKQVLKAKVSLDGVSLNGNASADNTVKYTLKKTSGGVLFSNKFKPEKLVRTIAIRNEVRLADQFSGHAYKSDAFKFELLRKNEHLVGTCTIKGTGSGYFVKVSTNISDFTYSVPGTYTYQIKVAGVPVGYRMDAAEWTLRRTISVVNGELKCIEDWEKAGKKYKNCTFYNKFVNGAVSGIKNKLYNGKAQTQVPVVKSGGITLKPNTDYTLSYKNNINVGKATVIITGKGNFSGKITRSFNITQLSLAKASVSGIKSKVYTGKAMTQAPVVKFNGKTLKLNTDYFLAYKNNVNTGRATIAIKGKRNYKGVVVRYFDINPKPSGITKLTSPKTRQIGITWEKRPQISGYQFEISTSRNFDKDNIQKNIYNPNQLSMTVSVGKAKTTYYIRIRTFKKTSAKAYFSTWSAIKTVKTK